MKTLKQLAAIFEPQGALNKRMTKHQHDNRLPMMSRSETLERTTLAPPCMLFLQPSNGPFAAKSMLNKRFCNYIGAPLLSPGEARHRLKPQAGLNHEAYFTRA